MLGKLTRSRTIISRLSFKKFVTCNSQTYSSVTLQSSSAKSLSGLFHRLLLSHHKTLETPIRFLSKGKKHKGTVNVSADPRLLEAVNAHGMHEEYNAVLDRFKEDLFRRIRLRISPDMILDISVVRKGEQHPLSHFAEVIQKSSDSLIVDLSANQNVLPAVREALRDVGISVRDQPDASTLFISQPQITQETRRDMVKKGKELLVRVKKEMDRVYASYDKRLKNKNEMKSFSQDEIRSAGELFKQNVKFYHVEADKAWNNKEHEILN